VIETRWRLTCELALPWRPFIDVEGSTVHRYSPARGGRVVEHVESWGISALEVRTASLCVYDFWSACFQPL
jgi:hypothetical protein